MRQIKFRIWDKEKKIMRRGCDNLMLSLDGRFHWQFGYSDPVLLTAEESEKYILMQFTGCNDKNNKEIWEGDIIRLTDPKEILEIVEWDDYVGGFTTAIGELSLSTEWEVIGNIYENKELFRKV